LWRGIGQIIISVRTLEANLGAVQHAFPWS
jgi:hypothetical protein